MMFGSNIWELHLHKTKSLLIYGLIFPVCDYMWFHMFMIAHFSITYSLLKAQSHTSSSQNKNYKQADKSGVEDKE
jgi:hypothetical protein